MIAGIKAGKQAIRESEARLRQAMQNMPIIMDAVDADYKVLPLNRDADRKCAQKKACPFLMRKS